MYPLPPLWHHSLTLVFHLFTPELHSSDIHYIWSYVHMNIWVHVFSLPLGNPISCICIAMVTWAQIVRYFCRPSSTPMPFPLGPVGQRRTAHQMQSPFSIRISAMTEQSKRLFSLCWPFMEKANLVLLYICWGLFSTQAVSEGYLDALTTAYVKQGVLTSNEDKSKGKISSGVGILPHAQQDLLQFYLPETYLRSILLFQFRLYFHLKTLLWYPFLIRLIEFLEFVCGYVRPRLVLCN